MRTVDAERPPFEPAPVAAATRRRLNVALLVISAAQLMLTLDELIVNTALPHIQRALHFSGSGLEWVVTGYTLTFGVSDALRGAVAATLIALLVAAAFIRVRREDLPDSPVVL